MVIFHDGVWGKEDQMVELEEDWEGPSDENQVFWVVSEAAHTPLQVQLNLKHRAFFFLSRPIMHSRHIWDKLLADKGDGGESTREN